MDQNKNYEKPVQKAYVKIHCNCMITYSHNTYEPSSSQGQ
jgi:hypothetical protein